MMEKWPNLFIVGAPKAGTTSLYEYLNNIPEIYMSPRKELHYFSKAILPVNKFWKPIRDKEKYLQLFKNVKNEKIICEASTTYLYDPKAPELIHNIMPTAKIIMSLRDPVERTFSNWLHLKRLGDESQKVLKSSFHEQLLSELNEKPDLNKPHLRLYVGKYSQYVKKYIEIFGRNQLKIIIFEEFVHDVKDTVKEIYDFLDLTHQITHIEPVKYNPYIGPRGQIANYLLTNSAVNNLAKKIFSKPTRKYLANNILKGKQFKPKLDNKDREILIEYFRDDVKKLENILGKKLPWVNFNSLNPKQ